MKTLKETFEEIFRKSPEPVKMEVI